MATRSEVGRDSGDAHDPVPAISRAAKILSVIASEGPRALGPSELSRRLGWPKSSLANICISLARAQLLRRVDNGYLLGPAVAVLGVSFLSGLDETAVFRQACEAVLPDHAYTVQLAMLSDGIDVIYLACHNGTSPVRLMSAPGAKLPANSTATGKAMLASLPREEAVARLRAGTLPQLTPRTITGVTELLSDLELVHQRGYALDDEETTEGVICIGRAVPHVDHDHRLAVSITLLKGQSDEERLVRLGERLLALTSRIGEALGAAPARSGLA